MGCCLKNIHILKNKFSISIEPFFCLILAFFILNANSAFAWCIQGGGSVCNDGCTPYWSQSRGPTATEVNNARAVCDAGHGGLNRTAACPQEYVECTSTAPTQSCTVGNEEVINDYDGWVGEFGSPGPSNPCQASNYIGSGSGVYENGFSNCPTSVGKGNSTPANPGTDAGKTVTGTNKGCISRVWFNGSTMANSSRCVVFGYRCSGGGTPSIAGQCDNTTTNNCIAGTLRDDPDNATQEVWTCLGSGGGGNASCSKAITRVNGTCSSAANQCTYGTFADVTDTATEIRWQCNGSNNGTNSPVCTAPRAINGVCGFANGGTYTSAPASSDSLCATGNPSGVSGSGPWNWSCAGINNGANASCSATLCQPPVDGICNTSVTNGCTRGSLTDLTDSSTEYRWQCNGQHGGNAAQCSRVIPPPVVNGQCNNAVQNACSSGTLNDVADSGTHFLWQCMGANNGTSDNCSQARPAAVNGQCSASLNGCSAGDFEDVADDAANYNWNCRGRNNGTTAPCSQARPVASVNGSCNNATRNACSAGTLANAGENSTHFTWHCNGSGGGSNATNCALSKPVTYSAVYPRRTNGAVGWAIYQACGLRDGFTSGGNIQTMSFSAPANQLYNNLTTLCQQQNGYCCQFVPSDFNQGRAFGNDSFYKFENSTSTQTVAGNVHITRVASFGTGAWRPNNVTPDYFWEHAGKMSIVIQGSPDKRPLNGECGSGHNGNNAPSGTQCDAGRPIGLQQSGGRYTWQCEGLYGGTTANCNTR